MPYEIKMYQCSYCRKKYTNRSQAQKHEDICFYNEDTKSCITCIYQNYNIDNDKDWCYEIGKEIFVKGNIIKDCDYWSSKFDAINGIEE